MTITPTGDGFTYDKDGTGIRKSADLVGVVGMATAPLSMAGSGITASASFAPAAAAYGAGDIMDVAKVFNWTFSNGVAVPASSLIRVLSAAVKIDITAVPSGQTSYTLHLYSVTPPSAQADNDAWTLASADLPSYRGSIDLGTPVNLGNALYVKTDGVNKDFNLSSSVSSFYGRLVTVGAHTAAVTPRQIFLNGIVL